jgi:uncharacterized protein
MSKNQKIIMTALVVILLAGLVYYFEFFRTGKFGQGAESGINSFAACAQAGYPIMETYPEQCRTKDGRNFTRQLSEEEKLRLIPPEENPIQPPESGAEAPGQNCKNLCGDGVCQEIVCLSTGCPCAENAATCQSDCGGQGQPPASPGAVKGSEPVANMANPASVNCVKQGGKVDIRTAPDGGQTGYCLLPDGHECEEWALFRGECSLK